MNRYTRSAANRFLVVLSGDVPVAGLFDGQAGQRLGLGQDGGGHRVDDGVHLFLRELGQDGLGRSGGAGQQSGLLDGGEIPVGGRALRPGSWRRNPIEAAAL